MFISLIVFIATFILIIFGIEYVMPPYGAILYLNPIEIIGSIAYSVAYVTGMSVNFSIFLVITSISIIPLIIVIKLHKICRKKRKNIFK